MMRLTRDELRGKAQTVRGVVDPAVLGSTLTHEHLIWDIRPPRLRGVDPGPEPDLANHWGMATSMGASPANA
jgi:phosphotriesterase-related protein